MPSEGNSVAPTPKRRHRWPRIGLRLLVAATAVWLGMNVPVYFRAISPLVLKAAAADTAQPADHAANHLASGRPGPAEPLLTLLEDSDSPATESLRQQRRELLQSRPLYRWSGGPAPFYQEFLNQADFLNPDEPAVLPSLLPDEHRRQLTAFLAQSANRNVQRILQTRDLSGWQRFYPVHSNSGQPLEATILATALLEQADALPNPLRSDFLETAQAALDDDPDALADLESFYLGILTLGRRADWLTLRTTIDRLPGRRSLLFATRAVQEDPSRWPVLFAALEAGAPATEWVDYLAEHRQRGWDGLHNAVLLGDGAVLTLLRQGKPLYQPPAFWHRLPPQLTSLQHQLKAFTESFPAPAMALRAFAFAVCGIALAGCLRLLFAGPAPPSRPTRRFLLSLDSVVGGILVMILLWILIEPGLLDFRPNEQGTLQINLAQILPESAAGTGDAQPPSTMIDQVTILVLLLFFVVQLLVFVFGLLKLAEVRRRPLPPHVKLALLDNEDNLFDLGLYIGLGGTVSSLILVVLNIVDASLMAAYASTLFGIIFVAILKVGFLRPFRRNLILEDHR